MSANCPLRKVLRVTDADVRSRALGIAYVLHLSCGHRVGLAEGREIPKVAPCRYCYYGG